MGCGLWWLWIVDCGHGGGAKLWVLIVVVVEWVATLRGFQIFFFFFLFFFLFFYVAFWLWISFDFGLLMVVDLHGRR